MHGRIPARPLPLPPPPEVPLPPLPPPPGPPPGYCLPEPPIVPTREAVERVLGFRVLQWPSNYLTALTHKSAVGMQGAAPQSFEKLEFLGDSVLGFVVTSHLYEQYPGADVGEGFLTQLRTKLVSGKALAGIAARMRLDEVLVVSPKARRQGFHQHPRILEDAFESLVGAVFLDAGMPAARAFVMTALDRFVDHASLAKNTNHKDTLMQWCQARALPLPSYAAVQDDGRFRVVSQAAGASGTGTGRTKRDAEQLAARGVLVCLGVRVDF